MENAGYVAAAWGLTGAAVVGYTLVVERRIRRAVRFLRAESVPVSGEPAADRPGPDERAGGDGWR